MKKILSILSVLMITSSVGSNIVSCDINGDNKNNTSHPVDFSKLGFNIDKMGLKKYFNNKNGIELLSGYLIEQFYKFNKLVLSEKNIDKSAIAVSLIRKDSKDSLTQKDIDSIFFKKMGGFRAYFKARYYNKDIINQTDVFSIDYNKNVDIKSISQLSLDKNYSVNRQEVKWADLMNYILNDLYNANIKFIENEQTLIQFENSFKINLYRDPQDNMIVFTQDDYNNYTYTGFEMHIYRNDSYTDNNIWNSSVKVLWINLKADSV